MSASIQEIAEERANRIVELESSYFKQLRVIDELNLRLSESQRTINELRCQVEAMEIHPDVIAWKRQAQIDKAQAMKAEAERLASEAAAKLAELGV